MKRSANRWGLLLATVGLLSSVGCDTIRDYSISSYQGPLPTSDYRFGTGSLPPKPEPQGTAAAQPATPGGAPVLPNNPQQTP